jgi:dolichyl-phosphate beta-glucosyltransferase
MYISVIIPARNEEKHIKNTTEDVYRYLSSRFMEDFEIIVVSNSSNDRTDEIVESMSSTMPAVKLIKVTIVGKGFAVKEGMLAAQGDFRLFMDADNATTIDNIERMMPYFDQGYSVVIGSIAVKGHKVASGSEPIWRRLFGKMGNLFIQIVAVPGINDTQRGFKVVTAEAAKAIFPKITIPKWAFDVEMLALARKFNYKIKEVPISWKNDPNTSSHPRLLDYFKFLLETVKVRWNLITGKYN